MLVLGIVLLVTGAVAAAGLLTLAAGIAFLIRPLV